MTTDPRPAEHRPGPQLNPSLLLHICCGPCAAHVLDLLKDSYRLVGYFCNPNVHPRDEYLRRLQGAATASRAKGIPIWVPLYDPESWLASVKGTENEPEGGKRCEICFSIRLAATARLAGLVSFDAFATTLTISPRKDATRINEIGEQLASSSSVSYLPSDFKKQHGFQHSIQKSKAMRLYRQRYCGCCFSLPAR